MNTDIPRQTHGDVIGQVSLTHLPRFAAPLTFGLLPDLNTVTAADVAIIGVPFDATVSFRSGARFGPNHIRNASRQLRPYNPEADAWPFFAQQVVDVGDVGCNPYDIELALNTIHHRIRDVLDIAPKALVLGGDHSISLPVLRAMKEVHGPISVIHFDAHLDTWNSYFDQPYLHGTPFRRAAEEGLLDPEGCTHVGIRGGLYGTADMSDDRALGFMGIRSHEVHLDGVQSVVERIVSRVQDRPAYISVDIDVLDPAFAPGTGTPESGGLATWQLLYMLRQLKALNMVGGDIMEVAPPYDHAEITGVAAAHVGYEMLSSWAPPIDAEHLQTR